MSKIRFFKLESIKKAGYTEDLQPYTATGIIHVISDENTCDPDRYVSYYSSVLYDPLDQTYWKYDWSRDNEDGDIYYFENEEGFVEARRVEPQTRIITVFEEV